MQLAYARADDLGSRIQQLIRQYSYIHTVNLVAHTHSITYVGRFGLLGAKIGLQDVNAGTVINANTYFAYTADNYKYILINKDNLNNTLSSRSISAFNGQRFQYLSITSHELFYQKGDRDYMYVDTLNPFFDPLYFLDRTNDEHLGYVIKLSYVQNPSTLKALLEKLKWLPVLTNNSQITAILPGVGTIGKQPFEYRIYYGGKVDFLPTCIEMYSTNPSHPYLLTKMEILDYDSTLIADEPFYWAKKIETTAYVQGVLVYDERVDVQSCQLNQPVNQNDFTIDFKLAKRITDWDTKSIFTVGIGTTVPTKITGVTPSTNPMDLPATPPQIQTNPNTTLTPAKDNSSVMTIGDTTNATINMSGVVIRRTGIAIWLVLGTAIVLILAIMVRLAMINTRQ